MSGATAFDCGHIYPDGMRCTLSAAAHAMPGMSHHETTDPTAGERECVICRRPEHEHRDRNGHGFVPTPAEPDAGDVEALASIRRFAESKAITAKALGHEDRDWLDLLILCDRADSSLDAVRWKAGDDRAEQIARDIRDRRRTFSALNADEQYLCALDDAFGLASNRIARESR